MCQFVVNNQLRFQGSASYAMVGLVAGAVINVVLDPLLILPHFFGLTGVDVAQAVADVCSIFLAMPLAISELRHMRGDGPGRQE